MSGKPTAAQELRTLLDLMRKEHEDSVDAEDLCAWDAALTYIAVKLEAQEPFVAAALEIAAQVELDGWSLPDTLPYGAYNKRRFMETWRALTLSEEKPPEGDWYTKWFRGNRK